MPLLANDIRKIAYLARLGIKEEDVATYAHDLSNMLGLMTTMSELKTDAISPMSHPLDLSQRLGSDSLTETNQRD
jgi:aspartyl-tRNA(Asn)/glutamyl-tRNA(Gln) amidotransferase subunit C